MRIGYLMNIYPVTSATFIRREMRAIEAKGHTVQRYAIRKWTEELVDTQDVEDQAMTHYILSGRARALITDFFHELVTNPKGMFSAMGACARLFWNAKSGAIRHVAYLMEATSLKKAMVDDQIEHLHAHYSTNTAAVALMAKRLGGPSFSFTAHGPDEFVDWGPSSLKFKVAEADAVVAITDYCRTQLTLAAGYKHWNKINIIGCGLDLSDFEVSKSTFGKTAPFVCVGRLCPQKAQPLIVEAIAKLVDEFPDIKVEFIGDGESREEVETAIARHGLEKNISLLGWKSNAEVREHLGRAKALLLPSFAEGLPIVIMESLATGRPVISTFIAGIPELVDQDVGEIIPAGSIDDIVSAVRSVMSTPAKTLAAKGKTGRLRIEERHDIFKSADKLLAMFEAARSD